MGAVGTMRHAASPSCLPAVNTRAYTYRFTKAAVLAGSWPLPDSRPGPSALDEGEGRQGHSPGVPPLQVTQSASSGSLSRRVQGVRARP